MSDLISRQAALGAISTFGNREYRRKQGTLQDAYKLISALPSAEPKTGEWIDRSDGGRILYPWWETRECSQCGEYGSGAYDFCPNCGSYNGGEK